MEMYEKKVLRIKKLPVISQEQSIFLRTLLNTHDSYIEKLTAWENNTFIAEISS